MTRRDPATLPRIIAHRGASRLAPENTIAAINAAAENGAQALELDAQITSDGVCVVFHDESLERCTNGRGRLADKTLAELAALDAGGWYSQAFAGEGIPRLDTALQNIARLGLALNLEIKPAPGLEAQTGRAVAETIRDAWPGDRAVLVSSFSTVALDAFRDRLENWGRVGYALICDRVPEDWGDRLSALQARALHCRHDAVTSEVAAAVHDAGCRLHVYTVNDPARARALFDMGVDAIFTDDVAAMLDAFSDEFGSFP